MPINIGNLPLRSAYVGNTEIKSIYAGSTMVWQNKARTRVDYQWTQAQTSPYRILFLGSSTMYGHNVAWPEGFAAQMVAHIVSDQMPVNATPMQRAWGKRNAPTTAGFHFQNAAVGGLTSSTYWDNGQKDMVNSFKPRLIVHMVGSNDYQAGTGTSAYRSNIERAIVEANTRTSNCRHLLVHQFRREDVTNPTYPWTDYRDQLKAIAASRMDTDFCDANKILAEELGWNSTYLQSDKIHADWFGNTLLARAVRNYLKLDTHDGETIYALDADDLASVSAGSRITSWPANAESLITLPATGSSKEAPYKRVNNGYPFADFYDGGLRLRTTAWPGAVAAPMTMFMVVEHRWNANKGNDQKPIFTRSLPSDDGFLWAWHETGAKLLKGAVGSAVSPGVTVDGADLDHSVIAITFHPNGWATSYVSSVTGTDMAPIGTDTAMGPWLKSLKLMTNTGETVHGEANINYFSLVKSCPDVGAVMRSLGSRFGITIKEQP